MTEINLAHDKPKRADGIFWTSLALFLAIDLLVANTSTIVSISGKLALLTGFAVASLGVWLFSTILVQRGQLALWSTIGCLVWMVAIVAINIHAFARETSSV